MNWIKNIYGIDEIIICWIYDILNLYIYLLK